MTIELRSIAPDDLDFVVAQTRREGWSTGPVAIEACLAHDPDGAFIAAVDGRRVGMVTTTAYRDAGFIGMLIVEPEFRSRGIGRRLMQHGLDHLRRRGIATIRLDGDPPGIPLYRSLGFVDEQVSLRFRCSAETEVPGGAENLTASDLEKVLELDRAAFGDDRSKMLRLFRERASAAVWTRSASQPTAYGLALDLGAAVRIGPVVAVDAEAARRVFVTLMLAHRGRRINLGVLESNPTAPELLADLGCEETAPSSRMRSGPQTGVPRNELIYAIADGAVG